MYIGSWINGLPNGNGKLIWENGEKQQQTHVSTTGVSQNAPGADLSYPLTDQGNIAQASVAAEAGLNQPKKSW